MKKQINYFVSYAHKDDKEVKKFLKYFNEHIQGRKDFEFKQWADKNIIIGEDWHKQIQEAIAACDLGVLLLSKAFFNSKYIKENELAHFINVSGDVAKAIFPIGIRKFDTHKSEMFGLDEKQIFFHENKFFNEFKGRHFEEFTIECVKEIERKLFSINTTPFPEETTQPQSKPTVTTNLYKKAYSKVNPNNIFGRTKDLKKLHKELTENNQIVLVNGMGGVGKTTLAAAYVFESETKNRYQKIVWITESENNKDIMYDFVQEVALIKNLNIDVAGKQTVQIFNEILHALGNAQGENLLVIDNATQSIEKHLDQLPHPKWNLLITSREKIGDLKIMPLGFLALEDAILLFKKYCTTITEVTLIKEIVEAFDRHTLTIEIIAKTAQKQHYDAKKLKAAFKDNLNANIKTSHKKEVTIEKIMDYIASIFDLSTLTENEVWLMKQFVCLPPNFHTYDLLVEFIKPKASNRETIFSETLHNLVAYGWLVEENNTYKMHRIITAVCKSKFKIEVEDVDSLLDVVTMKLHSENTIKEIPQEYLPYISNFGNAILSVFVGSEKPEINTLQNNLALVLKALGDYQGAKSLLETAVNSAEKNYGKSHPTTAVGYSNLATVLIDLEEYKQALDYENKALKILEQHLPENHPNIKTVKKFITYIKKQQ